MEWLQIYRIGKHLIDSDRMKPSDAFIQRYYPKRNSKGELLNTFVTDLVVDLQKDIVFPELKPYEEQEYIDRLFVPLKGNAGDTFFLAANYDTKKLKDGIGALFENKFKTHYQELIKEGILDNDFENTQLYQIRQAVMHKPALKKLLHNYLENLPYCIEGKKGVEQKCEGLGLQAVSTRINPSHETIAYVRLKIIKESGQAIYPSRLPEFNDLSLGYYLQKGQLTRRNYQKTSFCYFTQQKGVYAVNMPRDFINILKVSGDTNKNSQSYFAGERFLLSREAYFALKLGAYYIQRYLQIRIANKTHYIIPDFVKDFDLSTFESELKSNLDMAFQDVRDYDRTKRRLHKISQKGLNSLSFIGFEANDKSIDIFNRIQTVTQDRYNKIIRLFEEASTYFEDSNYLRFIAYSFTFKSLHYLIPEKKGNRLNIFALYKQMFEGHILDKEIIFNFYSELITKYKYSNIGARNEPLAGTTNIFLNDDKARDNSIAIATLKYLVLLTVIQKLNNMEEKEDNNHEMKEKPKVQKFFHEFNFQHAEKRAAFYLGKLLRRAAEAQSKSLHEHKPILNRVDYSGMKPDELKVLNMELLDKLRQYNKKLNAFNFAQDDLKHFEYYFSKAENNWKLSDIENVFYLFTGYGMYWEVIEPEKQKSNQENKENEETE